MILRVLDVGDGACSIIQCENHIHNVTVIDCGSDNRGPELASQRLLEAVGHRPETIDTIVITHFDTDHYMGLLRLAQWMKERSRSFHRLRLVAPRPPQIEPDFVVQYLAFMTYHTGIRNLDVGLALMDVTEPGEFYYQPVDRGTTFHTSHWQFEVHWPPQNLPNRVAGEVRTAMRLFEGFSQKLRAREITTLDTNLKVTREGIGVWPHNGSRDTDTSVTEGSADDEIIEIDGDDEEEASEDLRIDNLELPDDLQDDYKKVWDAFRRANNDMSLIFDDSDHEAFIDFGDAGTSVLRWLGRYGNIGSHYTAMLAPHHGTHPLPRQLTVRAASCISQNGEKRGDLWWKHVTSHKHNYLPCLSTQSGSHHLHLDHQYGYWCQSC